MSKTEYAFPYYSEDDSIMTPGMTLRDWFAGQALSGLAASWQSERWARGKDFAEAAYEQADAMMEARKANQ